MLPHELLREIRETSREAFVSRYPEPFLLVFGHEVDNLASDPPAATETGTNAPFTFRTFTGYPGSTTPGGELREVILVSKRGSNPYPERVSVGRARNCDIVLRNRSVSKLHAHFRHKGGGALEIVDLGSYNGTWLNGAQLDAHVGEVVASGDELLFGSVSAQLLDAETLYDMLRTTSSSRIPLP
ncbi:MAG TPA: FHA domain-containing protein [Polyangiaceae bacterium]|nr:FHA domain-containing protein [Polyangiaceae bacterium]